MAVNKVVYDGETLIDTSGVTVTSETMVKGVTALNAAGEEIEGTFDPDIYQTKTDETLETESKEVVGAINEVNGKTVDKIRQIDLWYGEKIDVSYYGVDGIAWEDEFSFFNENEDSIKSGAIYHRIPIMAGDNVTFEVDGENQIVKINSTGVSKEYVDNLFANIANGDEVAY